MSIIKKIQGATAHSTNQGWHTFYSTGNSRDVYRLSETICKKDLHSVLTVEIVKCDGEVCDNSNPLFRVNIKGRTDVAFLKTNIIIDYVSYRKFCNFSDTKPVSEAAFNTLIGSGITITDWMKVIVDFSSRHPDESIFLQVLNRTSSCGGIVYG